jgi:protein ImuB
MRRVASLYLPMFAIERLRRMERQSSAQPEPRPSRANLPVDDDPGACSVPRGGGWRPGARWARERVATPVDDLPSHRRPVARELGRRSESAPHPFHGRLVPSNSSLGTVDTSTPGPLILTEQSGRTQLISALCPAALALGLAHGMPVAQARALVDGLDIRGHDHRADQMLLHRFAVHAATKWTPVAAVAPGGLLLDLTGSIHLFGGEERLCLRIRRFFARAGFTARIAVAETPGAAHAVSHHGRDPFVRVPPGRVAETIAGLPLAALRIESAALDAARKFGLERIGDLIGLPRAPLARRLGLAAIERLDQALGRVCEPIDPVAWPEPVVAERRLLEPIGTAEAIGQVVADLCDDLCDRLRQQGFGLRAMRLDCLRVDGVEQSLALGTSRANRDPRHLHRLVALRIDRIDPGFGIEAMRLQAVRVEPLAATALPAIFAGDAQAGDLSVAIDRLATRIGSASIFQASAVESDVPERAVRRISPLDTPVAWPGYARPARLLRRPEQLDRVIALMPDAPPRRFEWRGTVHRIVAGDGPERIHGEWWRRDGEVWAVRDYFRVEDASGGRFWIFRRGDGMDPATGDLSWYLHGVFG